MESVLHTSLDAASGHALRGVNLEAGWASHVEHTTDRSNSRSGTYLLSALGGAPRFLTDGVATFYQVVADPTRHRVFYTGSNRSTGDTLGVGVLALDDGSTTQWGSMFAERGGVTPLADGTALLVVAQTEAILSLVKLLGPGQTRRMGDSPRPVRDITVLSGDLKRATAFERDYRADAWMNQVIRQ